MIATSIASSADFPQVSLDISKRIEQAGGYSIGVHPRARLPRSNRFSQVHSETMYTNWIAARIGNRRSMAFAPHAKENEIGSMLKNVSPLSSIDTDSPWKTPEKDFLKSSNIIISNIRLVSPNCFLQTQSYTIAKHQQDSHFHSSAKNSPEESQTQARYDCATTRRSTSGDLCRHSLTDMVHSIDHSLIPKALHSMSESESPVLVNDRNATFSGSVSSNEQNQSSSSLSSDSSQTFSSSFHTALTSEVDIGTPSPTSIRSNKELPFLFHNHQGINNYHQLQITVETSSSSSGDKCGKLLTENLPVSGHSKTVSSFHSNRHPHRILYRLKEGRRGMSKQSKKALCAFLPRLFNSREKRDIRTKENKSSITSVLSNQMSTMSFCSRASFPQNVYILLLEINHKLFEICPVDYISDMTVGDVLATIRTKASDPVLAAQPYKSLLNDNIEFSAPMLPLSLLLELDVSNSKPLLTALPPGSSPEECRRIQTVIMSHPSMLRFWAKTNPFEYPLAS